jgi:hypothetical protein
VHVVLSLCSVLDVARMPQARNKASYQTSEQQPVAACALMLSSLSAAHAQKLEYH